MVVPMGFVILGIGGVGGEKVTLDFVLQVTAVVQLAESAAVWAD
jgi:hypothetical protein